MNYRERLEFSWQASWPGFVAGLPFALLAFILDSPNELVKIQLAEAVIGLFVVGPFVIRRALGYAYRTFRFEVYGYGSSVPRLIGRLESLKVVWLLSWRTEILSLLCLVPISFVFTGLQKILPIFGQPGDTNPGLGMIYESLLYLAADLALMPLIAQGMLSKRYKGFHIEAKRFEPAPTAAPKPTPPAKPVRRK